MKNKEKIEPRPVTKQPFDDRLDALDCSVYLGRERLGRYLRTGPQRIVAFDADDKQLGNFRKLKDACLAISAARREARVG